MLAMEENKNSVNQLDEETKRHREMTQERKNKRKRILTRVAVGVGISVGVGAVVGAIVAGGSITLKQICDSVNIVPLPPPPVGGAMGQWEEVPMHAETA